MASKNHKPAARRSTKPRKPVDLVSEIQKLKKQIAELRKRLKSVESERDAYLRVTHEYLRLTENPGEIASGFDGEFVEGSLVDFFKQARKEYELKNGKGKRAS
jgi:hypothetical protein